MLSDVSGKVNEIIYAEKLLRHRLHKTYLGLNENFVHESNNIVF